MKATHRHKTYTDVFYFDVGSNEDRNGIVSVKQIDRDGSGWLNGVATLSNLEPIPAPPPRRPFDYESWRALLKQHGGNVWVRLSKSGNKVSHYMGTAMLADVASESRDYTMAQYEYSTDFGDTWQEMSRE